MDFINECISEFKPGALHEWEYLIDFLNTPEEHILFGTFLKAYRSEEADNIVKLLKNALALLQNSSFKKEIKALGLKEERKERVKKAVLASLEDENIENLENHSKGFEKPKLELDNDWKTIIGLSLREAAKSEDLSFGTSVSLSELIQIFILFPILYKTAFDASVDLIELSNLIAKLPSFKKLASILALIKTIALRIIFENLKTKSMENEILERMVKILNLDLIKNPELENLLIEILEKYMKFFEEKVVQIEKFVLDNKQKFRFIIELKGKSPIDILGILLRRFDKDGKYKLFKLYTSVANLASIFSDKKKLKSIEQKLLKFVDILEGDVNLRKEFDIIDLLVFLAAIYQNA